MAQGEVEVSIKMSPKQAGKMYMQNIELEKENKELKRKIELLDYAAESLAKDGVFKNVQVLDEVWLDGGGAPVYLEDIIDLINQPINAQ